MTDGKEPTFYQLEHLTEPEREGGKVSVCVRCRDAEGQPKTWLFWFADLYKAYAFRETVIVQDGLYR